VGAVQRVGDAAVPKGRLPAVARTVARTVHFAVGLEVHDDALAVVKLFLHGFVVRHVVVAVGCGLLVGDAVEVIAQSFQRFFSFWD
jgi:hypothetical protein